jgi:hypothetical protein
LFYWFIKRLLSDQYFSKLPDPLETPLRQNLLILVGIFLLALPQFLFGQSSHGYYSDALSGTTRDSIDGRGFWWQSKVNAGM